MSQASGACPSARRWTRSGRDAALGEVRRARLFGLRELAGVEAVRGRDGLEELLAPVVARPARAPRDRDAEPRRERLDRLRELEPVHLAHEVDDVAAGAAAEAVVQPLVAVDGERRRALVVERAEPLPGAARLLQPGVLADDLDDVRAPTAARRGRGR